MTQRLAVLNILATATPIDFLLYVYISYGRLVSTYEYVFLSV